MTKPLLSRLSKLCRSTRLRIPASSYSNSRLWLVVTTNPSCIYSTRLFGSFRGFLPHAPRNPRWASDNAFKSQEKHVQAGEIRPNALILHEDKIMRVVKINNSMSGRGSAILTMELKELGTSKSGVARFSSDREVLQVFPTKVSAVAMYRDDRQLFLMRNDTFEETTLLLEDLNPMQLAVIHDGMELALQTYDDKVVDVVIPEFLVAQIADCETTERIGGDKSPPTKKGVLTNNLVVTKLPAFIKPKDWIKVKLREDSPAAEYMTRVPPPDQ